MSQISLLQNLEDNGFFNFLEENNLLSGVLNLHHSSFRRKVLLNKILDLYNEYNTCHIESGRDFVGFKAQRGFETTKELADYEFDGKYYIRNPDKCLNNFWRKCKKFTKEYMEIWDDLILFNICFLHGKFLPYYHGGFLKHGAEETLLQLHGYGIFTENGQGNDCEELYKEKPFLNAVFYNYNPDYFSKVRLIISDLKNDSRIAIIYYNTLTNQFFDNVPYNRKYFSESEQKNKDFFTLTLDNSEPFTNVFKLTKEEYLEHKRNELSAFKEDWFSKVIILDIYVKEYCDDNLADNILLFYVKKHLRYYKSEVNDPFLVEEVD
jgi:hypothetical protein